MDLLHVITSKLAWVLLPLLVSLLLVGWWAWRRTLPSRLGLNVGFSLLLMVYLSTTAGLGIFWVANQHLPVFDWHYLFGYATVLLLAVHLAFNFRVVVSYLRHRRGTTQETNAMPLAQRRPLLGAGGLSLLGMALAGGLGYLLGLRHGKTEFTVSAAAPGTAAGTGTSGASAAAASSATSAGARSSADAATAWALVLQFHDFSAHSRSGQFLRAPGADWGDPPPTFKAYPGRSRLALPAPLQRAQAEGLSLAAMGTLLWHTAGVNLRRGGIHFRCAPSSGALFATELYLGTRKVTGLEGSAGGLWHHDPDGHGLHVLAGVAPTAAELGLAGTDWPLGAQAVIVATAVFRRSGHKYRDRTYRYVLADLGHALENLRASAGALGLATAWALRFDESAVAQRLALDESQEGVLALAFVGAGTAPLVPAAPPPLAYGPAPLAVQTALGVTDAVHRATSLRRLVGSGSDVKRALQTVDTASRSAPAWALPEPQITDVQALPAIAKRRSQRRFSRKEISRAVLLSMLGEMARPLPIFSTAVRAHLVAHEVADLATGAWRYDAAAGRLMPVVTPSAPPATAAELRRRSHRAALDQDVIGDAAAVLVLSLDRAVLMTDAAGAARGYRHGFLEAGLWGERLYLAATRHGLGVCAVGAFYDDDAAALVGIDVNRQWVVHFAGLGPVD